MYSKSHFCWSLARQNGVALQKSVEKFLFAQKFTYQARVIEVVLLEKCQSNSTVLKICGKYVQIEERKKSWINLSLMNVVISFIVKFKFGL